MGHHINYFGQFQSDKHPDLKPDHIILDFDDPAAKRALAVYASCSDDHELADDIVTRLDSLDDDSFSAEGKPPVGRKARFS